MINIYQFPVTETRGGIVYIKAANAEEAKKKLEVLEQAGELAATYDPMDYDLKVLIAEPEVVSEADMSYEGNNDMELNEDNYQQAMEEQESDHD